MSRTPMSASALHVRIGRLVFDPDVLDAAIRPNEMEAHLRILLAAQLGLAHSAQSGKPCGRLDAVANAITTRVRESLSGTRT